MELSVLWPEAQSDMSYGLITGHSDPGGAEFRLRSKQHPGARGGVRGQLLTIGPNVHPPAWRWGQSHRDPLPRLYPVHLAWLRSTDPEDGILVSLDGLLALWSQTHSNGGSWETEREKGVCCVEEAMAAH